MALYSVLPLIGSEVSALDTALVNGITSIASQMSTTIVAILPQIFTVIGIVMVASFAIRFFRNNTRQTR